MVPLGLGCSSVQLVSVLPSSAATSPTHAEDPLQVRVDISSVHLPLRVAGTDTAFIDVDRALYAAIETALSTTKSRLVQGATTYTLHVELIKARAELASDRVVVGLTVRATLKLKTGNVYIAQTHAHANQSSPYLPSHGADAAIHCANAIGAELQGWVGGLPLAAHS